MRTPLISWAALALLWMPAAPTGAQTTVGLITGLSRTTFTGGGASSARWQTGFMVGGLVEVPVGENLSVRPELHFATKGSYVRALPAELRDQAFFLSYIQIPVLAQLQPGREMRISPRLFGGVSVAVRWTCKYMNAGCGEFAELMYRSYDAGLVVGAELRAERFGFGVRYEAGLTPLLSAELAPRFTHGALSFTARYDIRGWRRSARER